MALSTHTRLGTRDPTKGIATRSTPAARAFTFGYRGSRRARRGVRPGPPRCRQLPDGRQRVLDTSLFNLRRALRGLSAPQGVSYSTAPAALCNAAAITRRGSVAPTQVALPGLTGFQTRRFLNPVVRRVQPSASRASCSSSNLRASRSRMCSTSAWRRAATAFGATRPRRECGGERAQSPLLSLNRAARRGPSGNGRVARHLHYPARRLGKKLGIETGLTTRPRSGAP